MHLKSRDNARRGLLNSCCLASGEETSSSNLTAREAHHSLMQSDTPPPAADTATTDAGPDDDDDVSTELSALSLLDGGVPCSKHDQCRSEHLAPPHSPQRNPKKGASYTVKHANWAARIKALKPAWYYTWGTTLPNSAPADMEFVPMVWCAHTVKGVNGKMAAVQLLMGGEHQQGNTGVVLSFNEPDGADQANMKVDLAVNMYAEMSQVDGLLIGSPAAVHADGQWMQDFVKQAEDRGLRIDFIAVHWYGEANNATKFINHLHKVHRMYGLPIWVTEFGVADWKASKESVKSCRIADCEVHRFMREVLPQLDALDFVHRYCWFSFDRTHKCGHFSALFNSDDRLTELGEIYANHQSSATG